MIWSDALEQAAEIRSRRVSAVELVDEYLDRIDRIDPHLRAYVAVTADDARRNARRADDLVRTASPDEPLPPFLGVALSIKDVIDVAGVPTTQSCKLLADHVAEADDPIVRRFREAGFVVLGKTNVPEFCTSMTSSELNGTCRNPWDLDRTPGGSSGGAASALAAGLCAVAHGTDGAGSVRVPAAFCGVVGVKPTRGLLAFGPEEGNAYYGTSISGIMTRSVRDAAAVLDVISRSPWSPGTGPEPEEGGTAPRLRVAVSTEAPFGDVDPECADAAHEVAHLLESLGHTVTEATPDWATILAVAAGTVGIPSWATLVNADRVDELEPRNRPVLQHALTATLVDHARWVEQTRRASHEFSRFWDHHDVLVTPSAGIPAPGVDYAPWDQTPDEHLATFMKFPNFAQPFNLSGQPGLSLPLAWHSSGLPIGVQVTGRHLSERLLFRLADELETARPWADRRPPAFG